MRKIPVFIIAIICMACPMKERVVVAMSGGVDSSVAAALLKTQGYEVIGVTACFNLADSLKKRPSCCGLQGIEDARRVAQKLGVPHYVVNMQKELEAWVIKDFLKEYRSGRTPNPCVRCNQFIKFGTLLNKALSLDAKFLATGHYARIIKGQGSRVKGQGYLLKKAKDKLKDQSYFLYRLSQQQLRHILFPLGNYTKDEARSLARRFNLPVADKLASQDICFLPDMDYRMFLKSRLRNDAIEGHCEEREARRSNLKKRDCFTPLGLAMTISRHSQNTDYTDIEPGPIVDTKGNVLGQHKGVAFYTIGQRQGLGVAKGYPLYITKIDAKANKIVVGTKEEASNLEFLVKEPHFIGEAPKKDIEVKVKIRYNHKEEPARLIVNRGRFKVRFQRKQFAITPGQSAVFYDSDTVLGGGIIDKVLDRKKPF